jgi:hypothetical protein
MAWLPSPPEPKTLSLDCTWGKRNYVTRLLHAEGDAPRDVDPTLSARFWSRSWSAMAHAERKPGPTERIIIGHLEGSGKHLGAPEGRFESGKW